jgi:hypothetical protein
VAFRAGEPGVPVGVAGASERTELDRLLRVARLQPLIGQDPPPLTLLRPDGRRVGTGHAVLLHFWTTTSPDAAPEMPTTIERIQRDLRERRFPSTTCSALPSPGGAWRVAPRPAPGL